MSEPTYSLDDLAERSETPARTIRYYIQRGLVSRPVGEKRGAHYTGRHLRQLLQIRRWVAAGMNLQRIGELMQGDASAGEEAAATPPAPWPEVVDRHQAAAPEVAFALAYRRPEASDASARDSSVREPESKYTHTTRHHYPVAPGVEVVIEPARCPLSAAEADSLLAVIREHLDRLDARQAGPQPD